MEEITKGVCRGVCFIMAAYIVIGETRDYPFYMLALTFFILGVTAFVGWL